MRIFYHSPGPEPETRELDAEQGELLIAYAGEASKQIGLRQLAMILGDPDFGLELERKLHGL